jgi:hypothetical protein
MGSRLQRPPLRGKARLRLLDATTVTWLDEDEVSGKGDDEVMLGAARSDKASAEAALWRVAARE